MAKQKIVIRVAMPCDKCRSKALALAAETVGVDSVALAGDQKDQVVVVGDGVDSVRLTRALRRKVGPAQLVQVGAAGKDAEEEEKKKIAAEKAAAALQLHYPWHYYYNNYYPPPPAYHLYPAAYGGDSGRSDTCSIM